MQRKFKERLLKLADYLTNKVKPKKFDLCVIVSNYDNDDGTYDPNKDLAPEENFCGTVACAIGYCPLVFPRNAKYLLQWGDWEVASREDETIQNFTWAGQFFGLTDLESLYLFDPTAYPNGRRGPKSVANRIKDFVRKDKLVKSIQGVDDFFDIVSTHEGLKG